MRSLTVYLKNYKKESILAPFFKFLEVVFDLIVPIVIAQIIDVGIANHDNGYIVQRFSILILMAALGLASTITAQFFAAKASVGFATELRQFMTMYSICPIQSWIHWEQILLSQDSPMMSIRFRTD